MQFHDQADRWTLAGATRVADLYTSATAATTNPAVTLHSVGTAGGQAAAFTYDLARSVVQTRQGNPAWAGQKRDGQIDPIRSDDLFFPNWVNLGKVAIPQADEQQRLLANLVTQMSADRVPMPRFWYFPRGERAVVVMTGDDHTSDGTEAHFDRFLELSPAGCSVADWDCVRSTSYVYAINDMTAAQVAAYQAQGFEIALHLDTGCAQLHRGLAARYWADQLPEFLARWAGVVEAPRTNRTHCIAWSDWASEPKVGHEFGIRLDTNYYYWPGSWVQNRPGMFTGSGIPMRFADLDGSLIDVYQATTQITDESEMNIPAHIAALLDKALGAQGYYGAFTANMHSDRDLSGANAIVAAAQARGVPVISAEQLLDWVEGRNNSSFAGLSFDGSSLRFSVNPAAGARGLEAMVPAAWAAGRLAGLTRNGVPVATSSRVVKGIEYLVFPAEPGNYVATYPPASAPGGGTTPPAGGPAQDKLAPRVRVRPRRVRVSRGGLVKLRVSCPRSERFCRVDLRLRRADSTVARKKFRVAGGKTRRVVVAPAAGCAAGAVRLAHAASRRLWQRLATRPATGPPPAPGSGCSPRGGDELGQDSQRTASHDESGGTRRRTHEEIAHGHGGHDRRGRLGRCGHGGGTDAAGHRLQRRDARRDSEVVAAGRPRAQSRFRRRPRSSTGRRCRPVGRRLPWATGGTATVAGGTLTVDGARANTTAFYDSGSLARLRRHVHGRPVPACRLRSGVRGRRRGRCSARAAERWPWASTRGPRRPVGPAENTPIAGVDPLVEHDYSIEWTPTEVRYFVDGDLVVTHAIAITAQMRPIASDFNVGGGSVRGRVPRPLLRIRAPGTFTSRVFDAGDSRATWRTLTAAARHPGRHRRDVRGPHRKHSDAGCFVDRLAAGRSRRRRSRARSGGATSSTGRRSPRRTAASRRSWRA